MTTYWLKRVGLTLILAVPIFITLQALAYLVFCGLARLWGTALDGVEPQDIPQYTVYLSWMLRVVFIVGPLLIGWKWAAVLVRRP